MNEEKKVMLIEVNVISLKVEEENECIYEIVDRRIIEEGIDDKKGEKMKEKEIDKKLKVIN